MSLQEHIRSISRSYETKDKGFSVEARPKSPALYCVREEDGLIELQVDAVYCCDKGDGGLTGDV